MAMYLDDANLVDLQAAKREGQAGILFPKKKQVLMSLSGNFLGVDKKFHVFPR